MKFKKKTVCVVLAMVLLFAGFSRFSIMAADERPDTIALPTPAPAEGTQSSPAKNAADEVQEYFIGGKTILVYDEPLDDEALETGTASFKCEVALPTPMPAEGTQPPDKDAADKVQVDEYVANGKTITIETHYHVDLEGIEVPEGFSEWETVTLYADSPRPVENSSYTPKKIMFQKNYLVDGNLAAAVAMEYEVWYYADNKVDLYSCTFSKTTAAGYEDSYFEYGIMRNIDGSASYTLGEYFYLIGDGINQREAIHFIVTPTYSDLY